MGMWTKRPSMTVPPQVSREKNSELQYVAINSCIVVICNLWLKLSEATGRHCDYTTKFPLSADSLTEKFIKNVGTPMVHRIVIQFANNQILLRILRNQVLGICLHTAMHRTLHWALLPKSNIRCAHVCFNWTCTFWQGTSHSPRIVEHSKTIHDYSVNVSGDLGQWNMLKVFEDHGSWYEHWV